MILLAVLASPFWYWRTLEFSGDILWAHIGNSAVNFV